MKKNTNNSNSLETVFMQNTFNNADISKLQDKFKKYLPNELQDTFTLPTVSYEEYADVCIQLKAEQKKRLAENQKLEKCISIFQVSAEEIEHYIFEVFDKFQLMEIAGTSLADSDEILHILMLLMLKINHTLETTKHEINNL